jgi:hypothetical protein
VADVDVIDLGEARWTPDTLRRHLPSKWRQVVALALVAAVSLTMGASVPPAGHGPLWTTTGQVLATGPRTVYTMPELDRVGYRPGTLEAREPRTGRVRWSVPALGAIMEVRDYGRGVTVAVSTMDAGGPTEGTIILFDTDTGQRVGTAPGQLVKVVGDGSVLVAVETAGGDCLNGWCLNVAGFSARDGRQLWVLPYAQGSAWLWGGGDHALASIRSDGEVRWYDLVTGALTTTWRLDWRGFDAVGAVAEAKLLLDATGGLVELRPTGAGTAVSSVSPGAADNWTFVVPASSDQVSAATCDPWICVITGETFTILDPFDGHVVASASSWITAFGRLPLVAEYEADRAEGIVTSVRLIDIETGAVRSVLRGNVTEIADSPGEEQLVTISLPGARVTDIVAVAADGAARVVGTIEPDLYCRAAPEILLCMPLSSRGTEGGLITAWPMPR